ncbi:unnamed protein product [Absidia cylindrospora]
MSSWWSFGTTKTEQSSPTPTNYAPTQPFKTMSNAFRKGVQYNMKIVIRGDVMTGKSTLFNRLQGAEFDDEAYQSTPQIQVANIPWHYKDSNDVVKIELWDVVDKAHNNNNKKGTGIKLEHSTTGQTTDSAATEQTQESLSTDMALDASTVDVYRNAHAALFIFDTTKQWTFDYVNNALASVPDNVAVLVLGNFTDKKRIVTLEEIHATLYEHNKRRIENGAIKPNLIRYMETSLKTGLGLKFIYEYFGVPFLELMMETLRKQLELKSLEILDLLQTLDMDDDVPELMRRRAGQDNFDQPSEPHLARQHESMRMAWNEELEAIATEHEHTSIDNVLHFDRSSETPSPPTAPTKTKKKKGSLVKSETPPPVVDQFDAGLLEDDWFGDDSAATQIMAHSPLTTNTNSRDEDEEQDNMPGNPMVARDEDVSTVEYYQHQQQQQQQEQQQEQQQTGPETPMQSRQRRISQEPTVMVIPEDDTTTTDNQVHEHDFNYSSNDYHRYMYQPPAFKSELNDVWAAHSTAGVGGGGIQSDSDDEDNIIRPMDSPYLSSIPDIHHQQGLDSSPFSDVSGGYEEIGGTSHHDNPWYQPSYDDLELGSGEGTDYKQQEQNENESSSVVISGDHEVTTSGIDKDTKKKKKKKTKSIKTKTKTKI